MVSIPLALSSRRHAIRVVVACADAHLGERDGRGNLRLGDLHGNRCGARDGRLTGWEGAGREGISAKHHRSKSHLVKHGFG